MDYAQYLEFLYFVGAVKYLRIDASLLGNSASSTTDGNLTSERSPTKKSTMDKQKAQEAADAAIQNFRFGRLKGRAALISRMILE